MNKNYCWDATGAAPRMIKGGHNAREGQVLSKTCKQIWTVQIGLFYYLWQKVIFTICRQTEVFVCICSHGATILYLSTYAVCPLYCIEFINLQLLRMGLFMSGLGQSPKIRQQKTLLRLEKPSKD